MIYLGRTGGDHPKRNPGNCSDRTIRGRPKIAKLCALDCANFVDCYRSADDLGARCCGKREACDH